MSIQIPNALIDAAKRKEVVLFAGAGISYASVKVGGLELRNLVGEEIKKDYPAYDYNNRSFEDVCDEYEILNDRNRLVGLLASLIPQNVAPLQSHIASVNTFRFIITTNWDQLFESASNQLSHRYHILTEEADASMFNYDNHNLLKIHGSIDRPRSLVCTTDDFEGYADTHANLLNHVANLIDNYTVLFVGYGMRDEHLRRLFYQIRRKRGSFQRRHYIVGFYDEVRKKLLEARTMTVINADAAEFLAELDLKVNN
jgi:hypothetical protein